MRLEIEPRQIDQQRGLGLEIGVKGYKGDRNDLEGRETQVFIEYYDGKVQVHVWTGESEGPTHTIALTPK